MHTYIVYYIWFPAHTAYGFWGFLMQNEELSTHNSGEDNPGYDLKYGLAVSEY